MYSLGETIDGCLDRIVEIDSLKPSSQWKTPPVESSELGAHPRNHGFIVRECALFSHLTWMVTWDGMVPSSEEDLTLDTWILEDFTWKTTILSILTN